MLELELDPPAPAARMGPGADARQAKVALPAHVVISFSAARTVVTQADNGTLSAFGAEVSLRFEPGAASYDAMLGRVQVPFASTPAEFAVTDSRSALVTLTGTVSIAGASWSLPVTTSAPTALGAAAGDGGFALLVSDGLAASWPGRDTAMRCGAATLLIEPGAITIGGLQAVTPNLAQRITLWNAGPPTPAHGEFDLRFPASFGFRFVSEAAGAEAFGILTALVAILDPPRTVNNERFPFASPAALIAFIQTSAGTFLLAEASAAQAAAAVQAIALKNLLLRTGNPLVLLSYGAFAGNVCAPGILIWQFQLELGLPILPDPYATNFAFDARRTVNPGATATGNLILISRWQPAATPALDFVVPGAAAAAGAQTAPAVISDAAVVDPDAQAIALLNQRFDAVAGSAPRSIVLLDLSSNVSQFGVAYAPVEQPAGTAPATTPQLAIQDLFLEARGAGVRVLTLPAVQWEPVLTRPGADPQDPNFPSPLTFGDSGGPTVFAANNVDLVPVAPRPAIDALLGVYNRDADPLAVVIRFTLPFGIIAVAEIEKSRLLFEASPSFRQVTPGFSAIGLRGGDQLSIEAGRRILLAPLSESPTLAGAAYQLHNARFSGVGTTTTVLTPIDVTFNSNFGPAAVNPRVPVTRLDVSGYGESLFSDWRNTTDAAAIISKAQFDVVLGRTSFEVIQARSVKYPYGVRVVRTITIQRENGAVISRRDSGWQPVTDGTYQFPHPDLITHPGVVLGVTDVANIRDTGQTFTTSDGTLLMAVRFDCAVRMENAVFGSGPDGVPARDQLGYVQLNDPTGHGQLAPDQYAELLAAVGPLGGAVDCVIDIGGSGQRMRVAQIGVAATPGMGGPEFAMAAWGSPILPGGGQWSFLRQTSPGDAPQPVDQDRGVPLVRAGAAPSAPPPGSPYRFADPADTLTPDSPATDYGLVHATGTQRLLFLRPKIETAAPPAITSTLPPALADPYVLSTSVGPFPRVDACSILLDPNYALRIGAGGNFTLELPAPGFNIAAPQRILQTSQSARTVVHYADETNTPSTVALTIDTAAAVPWTISITNLSIATESGSLGEVSRVVGTLTASAATPTRLDNARYVFGPPLQPVQAVVSFLENFGPLPPPSVALSNGWSWSLKAGLKITLKDIIKVLPPPSSALLTKFVDSFDLLVSEQLEPTNSKAQATFGLVLKIPTPFPPVVAVALAKFTIEIGSFGTAIVFQLGVGVGVDFSIGPFSATAYFAETESLITGDNVFGLGAGALIKGTVDLTVVKVSISVETKETLLKVTCNGGADTTIWGVAQVTFALDVTIAFVIDIEFDEKAELDHNLDGGPCALPAVV
ncbi:MAG TPA: hypothetical protein VE993_17330 [Stellaceae bacterium]|nr:hypothetical protein [Stellaceae bacterium]